MSFLHSSLGILGQPLITRSIFAPHSAHIEGLRDATDVLGHVLLLLLLLCLPAPQYSLIIPQDDTETDAFTVKGKPALSHAEAKWSFLHRVSPFDVMGRKRVQLEDTNNLLPDVCVHKIKQTNMDECFDFHLVF